MPKPWELTEEEARREGEELHDRLLKADRIAGGRFATQLAEQVAADAPSSTGREPWELTEEEARQEGERLRERLLEADRIAGGRFARQLRELADPESASADREEAPDEAAPTAPTDPSSEDDDNRS